MAVIAVMVVNAQAVVSALLPAAVALHLPVAAEEIILPAETIDMSVTPIVPPLIGIMSAVTVTATMSAVIAMVIVGSVNALVIVPAAPKTASAIPKRIGNVARMTGSAAMMIGSVVRMSVSLLPMAKTGKVRNSKYRKSNPHLALN